MNEVQTGSIRRLAIVGAGEAAQHVMAARLRWATILATPGDCDAVVYLNSHPADVPAIERSLTSHAAVLLSGASWLSPEDVDRLVAAAQNSGTRLALVNPDRYLPSHRLIRQQLDAGKLGEVGLVRRHRWEPVSTEKAHKPANLPPALLRDLDLVVWLLGKQPSVVYSLKADGYTQVHLGFAGGGMALIDHHDQLPPGDGYYSLSVIGSTGAAYADDHHDRQLLFRGGSPQAVRTGEGEAHLAAMVQDFVDALHAGREPLESTAAWRDVLALGDAVKESLASRQAIHLEGH